MSAPASERLTQQEYLAREPQAEKKSEYLVGQVFARAGTSRGHALIVWNILADGETTSLDAVLQLESIACGLAARDVYERVEVSDPPSSRGTRYTGTDGIRRAR